MQTQPGRLSCELAHGPLRHACTLGRVQAGPCRHFRGRPACAAGERLTWRATACGLTPGRSPPCARSTRPPRAESARAPPPPAARCRPPPPPAAPAVLPPRLNRQARHRTPSASAGSSTGVRSAARGKAVSPPCHMALSFPLGNTLTQYKFIREVQCQMMSAHSAALGTPRVRTTAAACQAAPTSAWGASQAALLVGACLHMHTVQQALSTMIARGQCPFQSRGTAWDMA